MSVTSLPVKLAVLLLLASLLRLWNLGILPNGLHWDEMDTGYQAYSLLKTGKDYFGNVLPFFPHSFADYRTPVFIYSAVPFVASLGLSAVSVRLVAVVWGLLSIVLIYLLVRDWLAPAVMTFSQWHLQYSRKSVETMSLTAHLSSGLGLFPAWSAPAQVAHSFELWFRLGHGRLFPRQTLCAFISRRPDPHKS